MANKKKETIEEEGRNLRFFSAWKERFSSDERYRIVLGIVVLFVSLFLLSAFISFLFQGAADQSIVESKGEIDVIELNQEVRNTSGLSGASIAEYFINHTFGIPCFLMLVFLFGIGVYLLKFCKVKLVKLFLNCTFLMIWFSLFLGFFFVDSYDSTFLYLGGEHGYFLGEWLRAQIGWFGTGLLLFSSLFIFLIFAVKSTLPFLRKVKGKFTAKNENEVTPEGDEAKEELDNESSIQPAVSDVDTIPMEVIAQNPNSAEEQDPKAIEFEIETNTTNNEETTVGTEVGADNFVIEVPQTPTVKESVTAENQTIGDSATGGDEVDFEIEMKEDEIYEGEETELYDPTKDLEYYKKPTLDLFNVVANNVQNIDYEEQNKNKDKIVSVLKDFGVEITAIKATVGPTVTLYEVTPAPGIKISKIKNLNADIAMAISAIGIRIIAPIPGKGTIGIEVPNSKPVVVPMADIIGSKKFQESKFELPIALGKTITNDVYMVDLCKMPHVLVAGATGQGKSVGLNAIITSLLYKKHPAELKFVMVDPKMVEFSMYEPIEKHFLAKMPDATDAIITDVSKVVLTLNSLCVEMDARYELLKEARVRQIKEYNEKFINRRLNPNLGHRYLPYIVVVIDEFADLIMQVGKEVETPIARIAQKARAVGIHMILATQRPSANVITGVIKANFPARFAFKVASLLESRVILDNSGAEQLIGRGDMLVSQGNDFERVQCAFVDTPEVEQITDYISKQQGYTSAFLLPEYVSDEDGGEKANVDLSKKDAMFNEAAELVVAHQQGSTSMIQRKFSIGYNRAGRIMDQLEAAGIVGPAEGSKPRQVLVSDMAHLDSILSSL